jgi:PhoP regulatory network protein YrbL
MLTLAHQSPLALGNLRAIHQHPLHAQLLIKTLRPEAVARRYEAPGRWLKRLPRARQYTGFARELKEYMALVARAPIGIAPVARMVGIVETDLGLGLVSEKIVDANGAIAPSLHAIYRQNGGASAWTDAALDKLLEELLRFNVIVGDLHASNVVFGSDSRDAAPRLILVDGFGEKNVLPLKSVSRWFNQRNTQRVYRRLRTILLRPVSTWGAAVRAD